MVCNFPSVQKSIYSIFWSFIYASVLLLLVEKNDSITPNGFSYHFGMKILGHKLFMWEINLPVLCCGILYNIIKFCSTSYVLTSEILTCNITNIPQHHQDIITSHQMTQNPCPFHETPTLETISGSGLNSSRSRPKAYQKKENRTPITCRSTMSWH